IDRMSSSDTEALLDGELELRLGLVAHKSPSRRKASRILDEAQIADAVTKLRLLGSRSEGEQFLLATVPTKTGMLALARHLDLTARKDDRAEDLVRRIVEATIGYRLANAAVEGLGGKRAPDESTTAQKAEKRNG